MHELCSKSEIMPQPSDIHNMQLTIHLRLQ